jgi:hypothetical protein
MVKNLNFSGFALGFYRKSTKLLKKLATSAKHRKNQTGYRFSPNWSGLLRFFYYGPSFANAQPFQM